MTVQSYGKNALTLNLKRFKQIDNEQYNSHTDPCTVYIRTVYHHHHHHHVNVTHGRSHGQIVTEANTVCSLRPRSAMLLNVAYADITSCPYLIEAGGCNTVQLQCCSF